MARPLVAADPLEIRVAELEAWRASCEAAQQTRDVGHRTLLLAIGTAFSLPFTASQVCARAERDPELAEALADADILDARQLGAWLREIRDRDVVGLRVTRGKRSGGGYQWRVQVRSDV